MRRGDKRVTDLSEIITIVDGCEVCRLGMSDGGTPYIVPMSFGFEFCGTELTLYFHCASEGRKLEILRRNPLVCFEMDRGRLAASEKACNYSYKYESVIGEGNAVFVSEHEEKARALKKIMEHYAGGVDFKFLPVETAAVTVLELRTKDYAVKRNE